MQPALQDEPVVLEGFWGQVWPKIGQKQTEPEEPPNQKRPPKGHPSGICWRHEMALELVCGADFWCNRHCKTSPVVLEGFWGQVWPKIGRKPTRKLRIENQQSAAVSYVKIRAGPGRKIVDFRPGPNPGIFNFDFGLKHS